MKTVDRPPIAGQGYRLGLSARGIETMCGPVVLGLLHVLFTAGDNLPDPMTQTVHRLATRQHEDATRARLEGIAIVLLPT